jgi:hypothetical protein
VNCRRRGYTYITCAALLFLSPAAAPGQQQASGAASQAPAPDPSLVTLPIPDSVPEILAQLSTRTTQVRELIDRGNFAAVFVPAFQGKDLAIALEGRLDTLSAARRDAAAPAIRQLVRAAWLLDASGDAGNRRQLLAADALFAAAASTVVTAFTP